MNKAIVPIINLDVNVKYFADHNGWKLDDLRRVLPQSVLEEIVPIPVMLNSNVEDKVIRTQNARGFFCEISL